MPRQEVRAYIYRVAVAVGLLLVGLGVLSGSDWPLWAGVVEAILVPGLAAANTPTSARE